MADYQVHFCPECNTVLDYVTVGETTTLKCSNCNYEEAIAALTVLRTTIYQKAGLTSSQASAIYDPARRHSKLIPCQNPSCPSLNPNQWGQRTEDGRLIGPDTVLVADPKQSHRNNYLCAVCMS
jgi:DNA-directed RNA polymerase subunit M/transcription elongation factor TFIIS